MNTSTARVIEFIEEASEILRRWTEQECGHPTEPVIKDRDINRILSGLTAVRGVATPAQVHEINRMVVETESLLNSGSWRNAGLEPATAP